MTLFDIHYGVQIQEDYIGKAYSTHREDNICIQTLQPENGKGRNRSEDKCKWSKKYKMDLAKTGC
jgi:hypothetical protein